MNARHKEKTPRIFLLIAILALLSSPCNLTGVGPSAQPTTPPASETPAPAPATPADDWARVKASGILRVGTAADYPPFSYYDTGGQIVGFDIALIKELARRLGVTPEISDFAFDGLLDATVIDQVDVAIAALSVTLERINQVDFTSFYYVGSDGILARSDSPITEINSPQDMAGQRVAVQRGSIYEDWVKQNLVENGIIRADRLFSYDMVQNAVRDLQESRVDLVMMDLLPAKKLVGEGVKLVGEGQVPQRFAMALRQGSSLTAELNRVLAEAQVDGTVDKLIAEYLKFSSEPAVATLAPPTAVFLTPIPPPVTAVPPACINGMAFVADLNYDDRNMTNPPLLQPGQPFTKSWRVRNSGTCNWDPSFFLRFVRGNVPAAQMNGQPVPVPAVIVPGATVDLSVNLIAPANPGIYQGFWQMSAPNGAFFGQTIWVGISVAGAPPTQPGKPFVQNFVASPASILSGQCTQLAWAVTGSISLIDLQRNGSLLWSNLPFTGNYSDCPAMSGVYTYVLTANGPGGSTWAQVQVQVGSVQPTPPSRPVIYAFQADPAQVLIGQCTTLSWNSAFGTSVQLYSGRTLIAGGLESSGSMSNCPNRTGPLTYHLVVRSPAGEARESVKIFVGDAGIQPR